MLPGILGLTDFLFSWSSVPPFPKEVQIKINSQCAMISCLVAGRQNTTLLAPKKYPPRLLLHQIQSPPRVSGISLIWFSLDSVLSSADTSPNPTDPCSRGLLSYWPIWKRLINKSYWETLQINTCFIFSLMRLIVANFCYKSNMVMLLAPVSQAHSQYLEVREWHRQREQQTEIPYH